MKKYIEWEEVEREINAQYAAGHMDAETSADMLAHLHAADTIEGLSKLQASCRQVNWISVEERLPKEWRPVLSDISSVPTWMPPSAKPLAMSMRICVRSRACAFSYLLSLNNFPTFMCEFML